jgi:hypothetical protein
MRCVLCNYNKRLFDFFWFVIMVYKMVGSKTQEAFIPT